MSTTSVRGMVQVAGTTYRIVETSRSNYSAIRILDNREVGAFSIQAKLRITRSEIDDAGMLTIAQSAVRQAKVSWTAPPVRSSGFWQ